MGIHVTIYDYINSLGLFKAQKVVTSVLKECCFASQYILSLDVE